MTTNRSRRPLSTAVGGLTRLLVAIIASMLVVLSANHPAAAVGAQVLNGRPGAVVVQGPQIVGYETLQPYGGYRMFGTGGVTVSRSTATNATQTIAIQYHVQKSVNGQWVTIASSSPYGARVSTTRPRYTFPAWQTAQGGTATTQGYYRIIYMIGWAVGTSTSVFASEMVYPNRAGETSCKTTQRRCEASPGWIFF